MGILIADSGGTKTDWAYLEESKTDFFTGPGLHPAYLSASQIGDYISDQIEEVPEKIYFYGAGCHGNESKSIIKDAFGRVFPEFQVDVYDDLTGAARAHLQQSDGIIAILGTGSICGRFRSGEIIKRSASLGFAIGDEGSAADLGRSLLKAYFRHALNEETEKIVESRTGKISYPEMMDRIYSSSSPNRELAKVAGIILSDSLTGQLEDLITMRFIEFIDSQMAMLLPKKSERIICTGKVAVSQADILLESMSKRGFTNVSVMNKVIDGLADYHSG